MEDFMIRITESDVEIKVIKKIKEYLGEDIQHVYHFPYRPIIPFCYYEDFLWIHIFSPDVNIMKTSRLKELIEQRRNQIQTSLKEKDFQSLLSMTENIIKIEMFIKYFYEIPDEDKYDIFRSVYSRSEYNFQNLDDRFLEEVFSSRKWSKKWKENHLSLKMLADTNGYLTIYRGEGSKSSPIQKTLSWTLEKRVAKFFAERFDKDGIIWSANVHIDDVLDYLPERNEAEVLIKHKSLSNIQRVKNIKMKDLLR